MRRACISSVCGDVSFLLRWGRLLHVETWGVLGGIAYCGVKYVIDGRVQGTQVATKDVVIDKEGILVRRNGGRARGVRMSGGRARVGRG